MNKEWTVAKQMPASFKKKSDYAHHIILQLLYNRGLKTNKEINDFLVPDYYRDLHDPFIFKQMKKVVGRIFLSIKKDEKIVIVSDSDTDGITSGVVLYAILKKIGVKNLDIYISGKEDGHGITNSIVDDILLAKADLIITTDCGISDVEEVKKLNKHKIDVIITDHHREPKKLPDALAIINPQLSSENYPNKVLAGVGVCFKVAQALIKDSRCDFKNKEGFEKWLLDLVAIGTISDCMPLIGENRAIVKYGLIVLNKTSNFGIKALINRLLIKDELKSRDISFRIAPKINACGRMNSAKIAMDLLLTDNFAMASSISNEIEKIVYQRQKKVGEILKEISIKHKAVDFEEIVIILGNDWPFALLGIISNRLIDKYRKPVIILSKANDKIKGSARTSGDFDLFNFFSKLKKYFSDFGGHYSAVGFNLKNPDLFPDFKKQAIKLFKKQFKDKKIKHKTIDAKIQIEDIDWELYDGILSLEPFGKANKEPVFLITKVQIETIRVVGKNNNHYQIVIQDRKMIHFNGTDKMDKIKQGDKVDIIVQIGVNEWNGQKELQIKIIDIAKL
ncbi:single-stranded-DNA-specific exonuclease RecJ [Patescibacteria group bacterium]|nr:single-stranded-DNA-specific exonuclease RecJ [Patescibacteria group bacterium]